MSDNDINAINEKVKDRTRKIGGELRSRPGLRLPLLVLAELIIFFLTRYIDKSVLEYQDNIYLSVMILQVLVFVLPAVFYVKLCGISVFHDLNVRFFTPRALPFTLFAAMTLISGAALIKLAMYASGNYTGTFMVFGSYIPSSTQTDASQFTYLLLAFALTPALCEEFVFRTVIFSEYSRTSGALAAVAAASLMSALMGFDARQFALYLFCGIVYSVAAVVTDSCIGAMLVHLIYNLVSLLFEYNLSTVMRTTDNQTLLVLICFGTFLLSLCLTCGEAERVFAYYAETRTADPPAVTRGSGPWTETLFTPTYLICVLIYIIGAILNTFA